jgi:WD40 repeat protein
MADTIPNGDSDPQAWASVTLKYKPPQQLGPCKLLRLLGEPGGQGSVWLAEVTQSDGTVEHKAVKVFTRVDGKASSTATAAPPEYRRERDLAMQAAPDMHVGDLLTDGHGWWFFWMRAVQGQPITHYCESKRLNWQDRVRVFMLALKSVQTMHAAGVIHRDLKPGNLFVEDGVTGRQACILDFGLATEKAAAKERPTDNTIPGKFSGTPEYAPPELLSGGLATGTEQSDLHALGVILHELLTGERLYRLPPETGNNGRLEEASRFWARDRHPKASELLRCTPLPPRLASEPEAQTLVQAALHSALMRWMDPILLHATHEEPIRRYRNALEFHADLAKVLQYTLASPEVKQHNPENFHFFSRRASADPWVRHSYFRRIKTHASLLRGAEALFRVGDTLAAKTVLEQLDDALRDTWEAKYIASQILPSSAPVSGHSEQITALHFSPDSTRLLTASDDGTCRIWCALSGKPIDTPYMHRKGITCAQWAPNGTSFASADAEGTVKLWDTQMHRLIGKPMMHRKRVRSVAFSPDGNTIVTASDDHTAQLWSALTGDPVGRPLVHNGAVKSACFSPLGQCVASATEDYVRLWNAATLAPIGRMLRRRFTVESFSFDSTGTLVLMTSTDQVPCIWDALTWKVIQEYHGHRGRVKAAEFSPNGHNVVSVGEDCSVQVWTSKASDVRRLVLHNESGFRCAFFSPDGARVITGSDDSTAQQWDASTGKKLGEPLRHESGVVLASFSPDGQAVVTLTQKNAICLWHLNTQRISDQPVRQCSGIQRIMSSNGEQCLVLSDERQAAEWMEAVGEPREERPAQYLPTWRDVTHDVSDPHPMKKRLTARWWDQITDHPFSPRFLMDTEFWQACFSSVGDRLITVTPGRCAQLWVPATGEILMNPLGPRGDVLTASFSRDGRLILTKHLSHRAQVWDAYTGRPVGKEIRLDRWGNFVEFVPDGTLIVLTGESGKVKVLDYINGAAVSHPWEALNGFEWIRLSGDGKRMLSMYSRSHSVQVRDASTCEPVTPKLAHDARIQSAEFSLDGSMVVTASLDKTAQIWSATTGERLGPAMKHTGYVMSAAFNPDASRVVTACTHQNWEEFNGEFYEEQWWVGHGLLFASFCDDGTRVNVPASVDFVQIWDTATGIAVSPPFNGTMPRVLDCRSFLERCEWAQQKTKRRIAENFKAEARGFAQTYVNALRARGVSDVDIADRADAEGHHAEHLRAIRSFLRGDDMGEPMA